MELGPNNNIEQLFKSGFEGYSPDVDPKVWNNIQKSLGNSGNGSGSLIGSLAGKLIIGTAAVTLITVSTILLLNSGTTTNPVNNNAPKITAQNTNTEKLNTNNNNSTTLNTTTTGNENKPVTTDTHSNTPSGTNVNGTNHNTPVNNNPVQPNVTVQNTDNNKPENNTDTHNNGNKTPIAPVKSTTDVQNEPNPENEHTVNVNINKQPVAVIGFTASSSGGTYAPIAITFVNKGKAVSQEWNFGDGSFSSFELSPVHIFEYPGEYTITLNATNDANRTEHDSVKILILSNAFFIPNTFTPNGDGNNDVYKVIKNDNYPYEITNLEIVVYDRTNQKVASFNSTDYGWDGLSIANGKKCLQGTYLVLVRYTSSEDGKSHEQRGSLFLKE